MRPDAREVSATCNLTVTFSPAAASAYTAAISVTDNAAGSPQSAPLTGTGTVAPTPPGYADSRDDSLREPAQWHDQRGPDAHPDQHRHWSISITSATLTGANPTAFGLDKLPAVRRLPRARSARWP